MHTQNKEFAKHEEVISYPFAFKSRLQQQILTHSIHAKNRAVNVNAWTH